jgi:hypothetical protein
MYPVRAVNRLWLRIGLLPVMTLLGCALSTTTQDSRVSVWARSHNRSPVDVYLLCGDHDATWLGVILPKESSELSFPNAQARCVQGLNFFLVSRDKNRGYWVGPMHPLAGSRIDLVIEKYAGLSAANLGPNLISSASEETGQ